MAGRDGPREGPVERSVVEAHRRLDAAFAKARAALRDASQAAGEFARLRQALETHFEQEDRLYYPTIWALRPERKAALLEFVRAHDGFRTRMREIAGRLETGPPRDAERAFGEFAEAFAQHEIREEELLRGLERELAPLGPPR